MSIEPVLCGIWLEKLVCIFVIFGRINIFSVFRSELERYSRFSNVLHLLRGRNHFFRSDFIFRLENPFKTPPVAIKRILWTCLVISWSQAPLSRSKAKSDGFTLYLSVSQMLYRVAYVLFVQSSFNGFHVHRWQVVSSQSFRPHFDPITLFYISLSFEITWFNQQQGMEMRMCHHVAIIPLVTSVVQKTCYPDLNRLVSISRFHESFMCFKVSRNSVTGGFFTVRVRNTQRWVGKRSWIFGNCWNITALQSRDLRHWHTGQWRTRQKNACLRTNFPWSGLTPNFKMPEQPLIRSAYFESSTE